MDMGASSASDEFPVGELPVDVPFGVLADGEPSTVSTSAPLDGVSSGMFESVDALACAFVGQLESQSHERVELACGSGGSREVLVFADGLSVVRVEIWPHEVALEEAVARGAAGCRSELPEGVRICVISNGAQTRYCSASAYKRLAGSYASGAGMIELTDWWADANGVPICDLMPFAKTFLAKHTLHRLLGKYCVPDGKGGTRIMRPREIVGIEREGAN